jgi:2-iminobutanoate/2-iminopropanoate deaminase
MTQPNFTACMSAGSLVFVSGQRGASDGKIVSGGARPELRQAFSNIANMLKSEGLGLENIVKVTLFIVDYSSEIDGINEEYREILGESLPARTAVGIKALTGSAKVAVDVIAHRSLT